MPFRQILKTGSVDLDQMIVQWFYQAGRRNGIMVMRAFGVAHGNPIAL
jgi:hypothetical protein